MTTEELLSKVTLLKTNFRENKEGTDDAILKLLHIVEDMVKHQIKQDNRLNSIEMEQDYQDEINAGEDF